MSDPQLRFIADGDLKPLARRLRMLGMDCAYEGGRSLPDLIQTALLEERVLLTLKHVPDTNRLGAFRLSSSNPDEQLRAVSDAFRISKLIKPFSRCLVCNVPLEHLSLRDVDNAADIPASVRERRLPIHQCPQCRRLYWHGSHINRMTAMLQRSNIPLQID